jgi:hypothetical protein
VQGLVTFVPGKSNALPNFNRRGFVIEAYQKNFLFFDHQSLSSFSIAGFATLSHKGHV